MSFIRIKRIDGKEYAYLVENKWYKKGYKGKGKGPRQKVSKYLGRVYSFNKADSADFLTFYDIGNIEAYIEKNSKDKIFKDLIAWELARHNIDNAVFKVDFVAKRVVKGKKEVSLKINEGFLNSYTLRRLFKLGSRDSYFLAKCFVEAGIEIPQELFVGVFGR